MRDGYPGLPMPRVTMAVKARDDQQLVIAHCVHQRIRKSPQKGASGVAAHQRESERVSLDIRNNSLKRTEKFATKPFSVFFIPIDGFREFGCRFRPKCDASDHPMRDHKRARTSSQVSALDGVKAWSASRRSISSI
jgi:hypothetical protein